MPASTRRVRTVFRTVADFDACTRDGGIALTRGRAGVRLTPRVVVADELGRTSPRATEPFGGLVQVKKQFLLDEVPAGTATLAPYLFCAKPGAQLTITVNGHPLSLRWPKTREYWQDSWRPVRVPAGLLTAGLNEVIFSGADSAGWELLIEHARWPRRSAKSVDGGRSWHYSGLGATGAFQHGEYLVRLEVPRHAPEGTITSPAIDLALLAGRGGIAADARVESARVTARSETPAGTGIALSARFGPTPHYDPATWSAWQKADAALTPPPDARFLQWQATLTTTTGSSTPVLRAVEVCADLARRGPAFTAAVTAADNPPVIRSSYPFAHQRFDEPRLELFRRQWKLDEIISSEGTDFDQLVTMRNWARRQWEDGWNKGPTSFVPPWDGMIILELASRQLCLGMCTHYSTALVHACVALGYTARTQIMRSHCIVEIWSDTLRKWVAFDHSGDMNDARKLTFHFERNGVPQSALEIHRAWVDGSWRELRLSPPEVADAFVLEERARLFERFCIHFRNDELSSLEPGEPEHGARAYHYDEYLWWQDRHTSPWPWFSRASTREGDFAWTVNHAQIYLQQDGARALRVLLDTNTPNLETMLCRIDGGEAQPCPLQFCWPLHPGENHLAVQPRNKFGRYGSSSHVVVTL